MQLTSTGSHVIAVNAAAAASPIPPAAWSTQSSTSSPVGGSCLSTIDQVQP